MLWLLGYWHTFNCAKLPEEPGMTKMFAVNLMKLKLTRSLCFDIQASCILQPMDRRLSEYIKKIVMEHGVTSTLKMKLLLEVHLKEFIFKDTPLPPKYNKRFWPSLKDIYNHMGSQLLKLRDSCIDQVHLVTI